MSCSYSVFGHSNGETSFPPFSLGSPLAGMSSPLSRPHNLIKPSIAPIPPKTPPQHLSSSSLHFDTTLLAVDRHELIVREVSKREHVLRDIRDYSLDHLDAELELRVWLSHPTPTHRLSANIEPRKIQILVAGDTDEWKSVLCLTFSGQTKFLSAEGSVLEFKNPSNFSRLFILTLNVPLVAASPPSGTLQAPPPLLVNVLPSSALRSMLEQANSGRPSDATVVPSHSWPLEHPFQKTMHQVNAWFQLASLFAEANNAESVTSLSSPSSPVAAAGCPTEVPPPLPTSPPPPVTSSPFPRGSPPPPPPLPRVFPTTPETPGGSSSSSSPSSPASSPPQPVPRLRSAFKLRLFSKNKSNNNNDDDNSNNGSSSSHNSISAGSPSPSSSSALSPSSLSREFSVSPISPKGLVLTDVNGKKYCVFSVQLQNVVVVVFSCLPLWAAFEETLSAYAAIAPDESSVEFARTVFEMLPHICHTWPTQPEKGYGTTHFKGVVWAECAVMPQPAWSLVSRKVPMAIFIRLLLAVLLDVSILVISNDDWLLLQTLEAVRALRLPPCPLECYFPVVSAAQALQQISSPTSIVTGCVGPVDRQQLQEAVAEASTPVLAIDLQGKELLPDHELLATLRGSPVFCATNDHSEAALVPLSFAMDPKAFGLFPSLYDNLCRACAGNEASSFSRVKDAYGHIMHELLSGCIWWTSAPSIIRFAEKVDRSVAPSPMEASFAATQAFIQWRSFARSYAHPLCTSRPVLVRPRFFGSKPHKSNSSKKPNRESERPSRSPEPNSPMGDSDAAPVLQLLGGPAGVYMQCQGAGSSLGRQMTLQQCALLNIMHVRVESLEEAEVRMILEVQVPTVGDQPRPSKCEHLPNDDSRRLYHDVPLFRLEDEPKDATQRTVRSEQFQDNSVTIRLSQSGETRTGTPPPPPPPPSRSRPAALDVNTHASSEPIMCEDKQIEKKSAGRDLPFPFQTRASFPPPPPRPPRERPVAYQPSARQHAAIRARWESLSGEEVHLHSDKAHLHARRRSQSCDGAYCRHKKARHIRLPARSKSLDLSNDLTTPPSLPLPNRPPSLRPRSSTEENFFGAKARPAKRVVHPKILVTDCSSPTLSALDAPDWDSTEPKRNLKPRTGHEMASISLESSPGVPPGASDSFDSPNKIVRKSSFAALGRWLTGRSPEPSPRESMMQETQRNEHENGAEQLLSPTQDGQLDDAEARPARSVSVGGHERTHTRQTSGPWLQAPKTGLSGELDSESPEPARSYWWSPKLRTSRARSLDEGTLLNDINHEGAPDLPQSPPKRTSHSPSISLSIASRPPFTPTSPPCSPPSCPPCRNPAQWLDANSSGVRELDLSVPVKYAGQLLRAIEASELSDPAATLDDDVAYGLWNDVDSMVVSVDGCRPIPIPRFKSSEVLFGNRITDGVFKGQLADNSRRSIVIKVGQSESEDGFDTLAEAFFLKFLATKQPGISIVHCIGVAAMCAPHSDVVAPCILLDCCDCSLEDVIKSDDPMWSPLTVRVSLAIQFVQAVLDVHESGVAHRNIKPSNVLVATADQRHSIWLTDFKYANTTANLPVSQGDTYFREREPDATSYPADVFALARVLSCLLAKRFPREDEAETISLKSISKELCSLLDHCTRPVTILRSKRPSAKHVLRVLQAVERELQTQQAPGLQDPMAWEAAL